MKIQYIYIRTMIQTNEGRRVEALGLDWASLTSRRLPPTPLLPTPTPASAAWRVSRLAASRWRALVVYVSRRVWGSITIPFSPLGLCYSLRIRVVVSTLDDSVIPRRPSTRRVGTWRRRRKYPRRTIRIAFRSRVLVLGAFVLTCV